MQLPFYINISKESWSNNVIKTVGYKDIDDEMKDLKRITGLPDLSMLANLRKIYLIDTCNDTELLPDYFKEKGSKWDDR